jgi:hypothetical protein
MKRHLFTTVIKKLSLASPHLMMKYSSGVDSFSSARKKMVILECDTLITYASQNILARYHRRVTNTRETMSAGKRAIYFGVIVLNKTESCVNNSICISITYKNKQLSCQFAFATRTSSPRYSCVAELRTSINRNTGFRITNSKKNKLRGFRMRANYTDLATAASKRS